MKIFLKIFVLIHFLGVHTAANAKNVPKLIPKFNLAQGDRALGAERSYRICQKIIDQVFLPAKDLLQYSDLAQRSELGSKLNAIQGTQCHEENVNYVIELGTQLLESHRSKVGVILRTPQSDWRVASLVDGIKTSAFLQKKAERFVYRFYDGSKEGLLKGLADLVFVERVGVMIGGLTKFENVTIDRYVKALMTVFLGLGDFTPEPNHWYFRVNPSPALLSEKLIDHMFNQRVNKFAIIGPIGAKETMSELSTLAQQRGLNPVRLSHYDSSNFSSLDAAVKNLFGIDLVKRADEYKNLLDLKRSEALSAELPFKESDVSLPPIKDFEGLVILDDFRSVRHILKLFKFQGVSGIKLFGNHLWRSPSLVSPWDQLLGRSTFVDFVGKYTDLPFPVENSKDSPFFVPASNVSAIDLKLVGYRASGIATASFDFSDQRHRVWPNEYLTKLISHLGFEDGVAFDKQQRAIWPVFSFFTSQNGIFSSSSSPRYQH